MKRIEAIIQVFRLDDLKERLFELGVPGVTVSRVRGCGRTWGRSEIYRGSSYTVDFIPKVRVEIVALDETVPSIVDAIIECARTGAAGDGKIFISPVDDAVRIRTGESGAGAL